MSDLLETIFYHNVIIASCDAAILSMIIAFVLLVVGKRIPHFWRHCLCLLVAVRLIVPALPGSSLSWQNWVPGFGEIEIVSLLDLPKENFASGNKTDQQAFESGRKPLFAPPSLMQNMALIWISGFVLILTNTWLQYRRFVKRVRLLRALDDEATARVTDLLNRLVKEAKLYRAPAIVITDGVSSPAVSGIFRPKFLLPPKLIAELSDAEISFVLRHELAHFQRLDVWTNWLLAILQAVHWFNPIIWWTFRQTRIEAERATDARVLQSIGHAGATKYGDTLIRILEQTFSKTKKTIPGVIGVAESRRELRNRISLIASFTGKRQRLATVSAIGLIMAIATAGLTQAPKKEGKETGRASSTESTANSLKVSLPKVEFRDQPLSEVLKWLESKFPENGPKFVVDDKVDQSREITLVMSNVPIAEVLRYTTGLTSTEYRFDGNSIIISPASDKSPGTVRPARRSVVNNIRGPSIQFGDGLPVYQLSPKLKEIGADYEIEEFSVSNKSLSSAIAQLVELSKTIDPDGKGIEIAVSEEVVQKKALQFSLKKVSLLSATEYMARAFGAVTTIKDGKILIVPDKNPEGALVMHVWNVLPDKFAGKDPKEVLVSAGVEFPDGGSAVLYVEDKNQLIIRHTKANCEKVETWLSNTKTLAPR